MYVQNVSCEKCPLCSVGHVPSSRSVLHVEGGRGGEVAVPLVGEEDTLPPALPLHLLSPPDQAILVIPGGLTVENEPILKNFHTKPEQKHVLFKGMSDLFCQNPKSGFNTVRLWFSILPFALNLP